MLSQQVTARRGSPICCGLAFDGLSPPTNGYSHSASIPTVQERRPPRSSSAPFRSSIASTQPCVSSSSTRTLVSSCNLGRPSWRAPKRASASACGAPRRTAGLVNAHGVLRGTCTVEGGEKDVGSRCTGKHFKRTVAYSVERERSCRVHLVPGAEACPKGLVSYSRDSCDRCFLSAARM